MDLKKTTKNKNKEIGFEPNQTNSNLSTGLQNIESLPQESGQGNSRGLSKGTHQGIPQGIQTSISK